MVVAGAAVNDAAVPVNADTLGGRPANDYVTDEEVVYYSGDITIDETVPLNADTLQGYKASDFAPAGFGLGEAWGGEIADCNDAIANGWFNINASVKNIPTLHGTSFPYSTMLVTARYDLLWQEVYSLLYGVDYKFTRHSTDRGVTWTEWCCDNPPMEVGVEYRTTERFDGKVVYARLLNCGAIATSGEVNHSLHFTHLVSFSAECNGTFNNTFDKGSEYYFNAWANRYYVWFEAGSLMVADAKGSNVYATLKYIKD